MIADLAKIMWVRLGWGGVALSAILLLLFLKIVSVRLGQGLGQVIKSVFRMIRITKWIVRISVVIGLAGYYLYWRSQTEPIHIHIVEEHHEVLQKWFDAVAEGRISPSNVTLIHIHGHLELNLPQYFSGMKAFPGHNNREIDVSMYMQRNNMFIPAAAILGLVSRVIWIWPSWNFEYRKPSYQASTVYFGWYSSNAHQSNTEFCRCQGSSGALVLDSSMKLYKCHRMGSTEQQEVEIPITDCNIKTSFLLEQINQDEALSMLQNPNEVNWIRGLGLENGSNRIWDIDEEYFGSEYAAERMGDYWEWMKNATVINNLLSDLICISESEQEALGNNLLINLLKSFSLSKTFMAKFIYGELFTLFATANKLALQMIRNHPTLFCDTNADEILDKWRNITLHLYQLLTPDQVTELMKSGFCLTRSLKSSSFIHDRKPASLRICQALRKPAWFYSYVPGPSFWSWSNKIEGLELFESLVRVLPKPGLVTLSRSVRDGYTPRNMAGDIEKGVLKALNGKLINTLLNYDPNLFEGVEGWNAWSSKNKL